MGDLRRAELDRALGGLDPRRPVAVEIAAPLLGAALAVVLAEGIADFRLPRLRGDEPRRQLRPAIRRRSRHSISAVRLPRMRIDAGILLFMGYSLAGAGGNRRKWWITPRQAAPLSNLQRFHDFIAFAEVIAATGSVAPLEDDSAPALVAPSLPKVAAETDEAPTAPG